MQKYLYDKHCMHVCKLVNASKSLLISWQAAGLFADIFLGNDVSKAPVFHLA